MGQLLLGQIIEHIALILFVVQRLAQPIAAVHAVNAGVVAGDHIVIAQGDGAATQGVKL